MLFDTHAHLDDKQFDTDRDDVIKSLKNTDVGLVMNIGASMSTSRASVALADKYDFIYASVGVHPDEVYDMSEADIDELRQMALDNKKVRAIGEIGLDYHYDDAQPEKQKKWFIRQLELAKELNMPVIIHDRDSKGDTIKILKEAGVTNGVMHCYSGSKETAAELVKMGFMISFTGVLTFKNAKRAVEACKEIPLDRLMVETDCPYMSPEPHRGERNYSGYVEFVARKMAEIKNVTYEELARITTENALRFYGI